MATSAWHHAAVAVGALAGEDPATLRAALEPEALAEVDARLRWIEAGRGSDARARRVVAERLRATRPSASDPPAPSASRVLSLWLAAQPRAARGELARALPHAARDAARREADLSRRHAGLGGRIAPWISTALRALGRLPSERTWDELVADLAGERAARDPDALRIERALRVAGRRADAAAVARALRGAT